MRKARWYVCAKALHIPSSFVRLRCNIVLHVNCLYNASFYQQAPRDEAEVFPPVSIAIFWYDSYEPVKREPANPSTPIKAGPVFVLKQNAMQNIATCEPPHSFLAALFFVLKLFFDFARCSFFLSRKIYFQASFFLQGIIFFGMHMNPMGYAYILYPSEY